MPTTSLPLDLIFFMSGLSFWVWEPALWLEEDPPPQPASPNTAAAAIPKAIIFSKFFLFIIFIHPFLISVTDFVS